MTAPPTAGQPARAWRYVHDDSDNRDQAIIVPRGPRDCPERRRNPDVFIDTNVLRRLIGDVETLHAYVTLRTWQHRGEEVSTERYCREFGYLMPGHPWPLQRLHDRGLLISPEEGDRRIQAFDAIIYGPEDERHGGATPWESLLTRPEVRAKRPLPDPFPAYGNGEWAGTREGLLDTPHPSAETSVVYHLFDDTAARIYTGSTSNLCNRFAGHTRKPWVRYEARECASREDAYWLEAAAIIEYRPPLNANDFVGGRINALIAAGVR